MIKVHVETHVHDHQPYCRCRSHALRQRPHDLMQSDPPCLIIITIIHSGSKRELHHSLNSSPRPLVFSSLWLRTVGITIPHFAFPRPNIRCSSFRVTFIEEATTHVKYKMHIQCRRLSSPQGGSACHRYWWPWTVRSPAAPPQRYHTGGDHSTTSFVTTDQHAQWKRLPSGAKFKTGSYRYGHNEASNCRGT